MECRGFEPRPAPQILWAGSSVVERPDKREVACLWKGAVFVCDDDLAQW